MEKVFKELDKVDKNWKNKKITARFICALSVYGPKTRKIHAVAKIEGRISNKKIGKNGFGYDPIFIPSGKKVYDWQVPNEWHVREAWIKNSDGNKILDFKRNNLHLLGYSSPIKKDLNFLQLKNHLHYIDDKPDNGL